MILFVFLITSCATPRFYTKEISIIDVENDVSKLQLQDFSLHSTADVYNYCLSRNENTDVELVLRLYCASELLARDDLSKSISEYAIRLYNRSLYSLLKMNESEQETRSNIIIVKNISNQFIYSEEMNALESRLQPKIFGDLGVPIVTTRANTATGLDLYYPLEGVFQSESMIASEVKIKNEAYYITIESIPLIDTNKLITFGDQSYSLRHSQGSAFLGLIEKATIDDFSWLGFVSPTQAEKRRGVFAIGKIDKNKTPLFMIHGLNSDPLIWRYLTMALLNEPILTQKLQIFHIYYPSGAPPFYTAMRTRDNLKELIKDVYEGFNKNAIIIGHSMGGVIAKLLTTQSDNHLWQTTFTKKPEEILGKENAKIKDIFVFEPSFKDNTLFLLDTPLKGSETANTLIGALGSALISLPDEFTQLFQQLLSEISVDIITPKMRPLLENYGPNSVEVLRPGHPLMDTLYRLPISGRSYAIIGSADATYCQTNNECSTITDGVVSFDSANYQYAEERLIVPSNHNSFQTNEAIKFIVTKIKKLMEKP